MVWQLAEEMDHFVYGQTADDIYDVDDIGKGTAGQKRTACVYHLEIKAADGIRSVQQVTSRTSQPQSQESRCVGYHNKMQSQFCWEPQRPVGP